MRLIFIIFLFSINGCSVMSLDDSASQKLALKKNIPRLPVLDDKPFGSPLSIVPLEQVYKLSEKQKNNFLESFYSEAYQSELPNQRIFHYLEDNLDQFNYFSNTYIATDALTLNSGNCLSLAILTNALAKLIEVDIAYELVATPPVYQKQGNLVLSSQHIRSILFNPIEENEKTFLILRGGIKVDYFPSRGTHRLRRISENEFDSMYYNNKAAEALIKDENDLAFWYLKKSLSVKEAGSQEVNMMAVLYARMGNYQMAEKLYLYGIEHGEKTLELLKNYHNLLVKTHRYEEANKIALSLYEYDDPDPFKWVTLGDESFAKEEYSSAIRYYNKAIKIASYLHEPYAGIARSQYMRGNLRLAKQSMEIALEKSHQKETTSIYKIKYDLLSKLSN